MFSIKKGVGLILMFFFLINLVTSASTIQVQENPVPEKKSWFSFLDFLKSPVFWYAIIIFLVVVAVLLGIFFLVRYIVKFLKSRNNIFWKMRNERIKMAKIQRTYSSSKHWLKIEKNIPVRLVKRNDDGRAFITNPVGYHRGDYTSHEGNIIISMNLKGNNKWWFFPITDLLIIPNKSEIEIYSKDKKGKQISTKIDNIPTAKEIVQFNENEILVYAESLSLAGEFLVPVLKTKTGKILDLSLPTYIDLKNVVLQSYLYEQSDDFVKIAKQTMNLNPHLRFEVKSNDGGNQSTEIPTTK
jgi:hypothetical protein